jgi:NAD(P)-dependent dehydrogenase (short-subunit alcohol dehydrogenase family)
MARYLISGVSRGIGWAVASQLVAAGHEVFGLFRSATSQSAAADLGLAGMAAVDLARPEAIADALASVLASLSDADGLDGLVHAAGVIHHGALRDAPFGQLADQLTVNVTAVAELTRLLLPALRQREGAVVFVNSGSGLTARSDLGGYSASKFAVRALADALRQEEPTLRVSSLYPGPTATDMQRDLRRAQALPYREHDYLRPETVAGVICSLLQLPTDGVITEISLRPTGR